jgi:uncharacterized membrane protein
MSAATSPGGHIEDRGPGQSPSPPVFRFGHESGGPGGEWAMEWRLKRNCSMAPRQLLGFYSVLCVALLAVASVFWWLGARLVMPFAWIELIGVGIALRVYARHASDNESIALQGNRLTVELASGNRLQRMEFQPQWVRIEPQDGDGSLVELSGQGRRIAVGRYMRPELRPQLANELRMALRRSR